MEKARRWQHLQRFIPEAGESNQMKSDETRKLKADELCLLRCALKATRAYEIKHFMKVIKVKTM